jgi:hypothetical protein
MRFVVFLLALAVPPSAFAQASTPADLYGSLRGDWVGVLEYRDYSEPVGSTKRVDLPTWLTISGDVAESWHYVYDDGPTKTVSEDDAVAFDFEKSTLSETSGGKPAQVFRVMGLEALKGGKGVLQMTGSGTDNGKPSERRMVLTVRRNLLEVLEEVRPAGSGDAFAFRHLYRMVRATPPVQP